MIPTIEDKKDVVDDSLAMLFYKEVCGLPFLVKK